MNRFKKHIFICENMRPADHPKGCCGLKGSAELRKILKAELAQAVPNNTYRVNSAGCLDACEHGPVMVIYPEGIWYGNFKKSDFPEIIESSIKHKIKIERLAIASFKDLK